MVSMAGDLEVYETKKAGFPVTGIIGDSIVREYPDGRREIVGPAPRWVPVKKREYIIPPYNG
jgi:hypothetical protein